MSEETYGITEVSSMSGVTQRQLTYWDDTGLLGPSAMRANGSGTQRRYSAADLRLVRLVKKLLDAGISLQQIRTIGEALADHASASEEGFLLISDDVVVARNAAEIVAALLASDQVVHVVRFGGPDR